MTDENKEIIGKIYDNVRSNFSDEDLENMDQALGGVLAIVFVVYFCCICTISCAFCTGMGLSICQIYKRCNKNKKVDE